MISAQIFSYYITGEYYRIWIYCYGEDVILIFSSGKIRSTTRAKIDIYCWMISCRKWSLSWETPILLRFFDGLLYPIFEAKRRKGEDNISGTTDISFVLFFLFFDYNSLKRKITLSYVITFSKHFTFMLTIAYFDHWARTLTNLSWMVGCNFCSRRRRILPSQKRCTKNWLVTYVLSIVSVYVVMEAKMDYIRNKAKTARSHTQRDISFFCKLLVIYSWKSRSTEVRITCNSGHHHMHCWMWKTIKCNTYRNISENELETQWMTRT